MRHFTRSPTKPFCVYFFVSLNKSSANCQQCGEFVCIIHLCLCINIQDFELVAAGISDISKSEVWNAEYYTKSSFQQRRVPQSLPLTTYSMYVDSLRTMVDIRYSKYAINGRLSPAFSRFPSIEYKYYVLCIKMVCFYAYVLKAIDWTILSRMVFLEIIVISFGLESFVLFGGWVHQWWWFKFHLKLIMMSQIEAFQISVN